MWVQKSLFQVCYQSMRNPSTKLNLIFCCTYKNFLTHTHTHTTTLNSVKIKAINFLSYLWRLCCIPLLVLPSLYFLFLPGFLLSALLKLCIFTVQKFSSGQAIHGLLGKLFLRCFSCGHSGKKYIYSKPGKISEPFS